jgi:hypothetical protein
MTAASTLLAADPGVPQRDVLLDAREMAERFVALLGTSGPLRVEECRRLRTKYRIGESLRALYWVRVDGAWHRVSARTFPAGRSDEAFRRASAAAVPCGPLRSVVHDAEIAAVFWTFPNDRKIATLPILQSGAGDLAELLGRARVEPEVVAYAPEQSATARCVDRAGRNVAYAKVYAADAGARTYRIHGFLAARAQSDGMRLRVPRALAYSPTHRALLLEPIDGRHVVDLDGAHLQSGLRRWGAALATLHGFPPPDAPRFERVDPGHLEQAAHVIGLGCPELSRSVHELARELVGRQPRPTDPPVCLHGDVHPRNGIVTDEGFALVDLDQVAVGSAAADLGSLLAWLRCRRRVGLLSAADEHQLADAFLEGYGSVRAVPDAADVRWHTAAALLTERALRAVTWVRPDVLDCLTDLIGDARALIDGDDDG